MKKLLFLIIAATLVFPAFASQWTFLAYIMAAPDMEEEMVRNLQSLSRIGSNANIEVIAQVDWTKEQPGNLKKQLIPNPAYTGSARYRIEKNRIVELEQLGEVNSGDEKVFWKFLDSSTPKGAGKCMLLLGSHGSGFESWQEINEKSDEKCISYDDKENDSLTLLELDRCLVRFRTKIGCPVKFLIFDSCLMMNVHVAYQLRKSVEMLVGSDSGLFIGNGNYAQLISTVSVKPDTNITILAKEITQAFATDLASSTLGSVTACFVAPRFSLMKDYISWLADEMIKCGYTQAGTGVALFGNPPRYCDIGELCAGIHKSGTMPDGRIAPRALKDMAESLLALIEDARLAFNVNGMYHTRDLCGLSIWLPSQEDYARVRKFHQTTALGKDSRWGNYLDWRYGVKHGGTSGLESDASENWKLDETGFSFLIETDPDKDVSVQYENRVFRLPDVKDGDIIFQQSQSGQSPVIQKLTNSIYTHCGIIIHISGEPFVFEASSTVRFRSLSDFIQSGKSGHYVIKRLIKGLSDADAAKLKQAGLKFKGKSYDSLFLWSDSKIYCSELVYKIFLNGLGKEIGSTEKFKDFDCSDPKVKAEIIRRFGSWDKVPWNETVISPKALMKSWQLYTAASN
ncbi:MAG: YiiX/YebB-like N1pC/P60 family cysteine hydrolase [Candidatus Wallbacteria bacterium]|nr:YiiX/YebB-like N1pC/P60 family cysteine hydrolase [Candidatus Wallbacteria bacterium]